MTYSYTFALLAIFATFTYAADTCYWPNGQKAPDNYLPCAGSKVCCAEGEACLSNNLCYGSKLNIAYRGACTDISWPIAECPRICYEEIRDQWANLYACPNSTNQVFTCGTSGWSSTVCDANLGQYDWVEAQVVLAQNGDSSSSSTPSATAGTGSSVCEPTATVTLTDESVTDDSHQQQQVRTTAIGLGIGLGVPLLAMSFAFVWLWVRTRRQLAERPLSKPLDENPTAFFDKTSHHPQVRLGELSGSKNHANRSELE